MGLYLSLLKAELNSFDTASPEIVRDANRTRCGCFTIWIGVSVNYLCPLRITVLFSICRVENCVYCKVQPWGGIFAYSNPSSNAPFSHSLYAVCSIINIVTQKMLTTSSEYTTALTKWKPAIMLYSLCLCAHVSDVEVWYYKSHHDLDVTFI